MVNQKELSKTDVATYNEKVVHDLLNKAQEYADTKSQCTKVAVGAVAKCRHQRRRVFVYGANKTLPVSCKTYGCRRVKLYGEASKEHRLPSDCRALHAEIDLISQAAVLGCRLKGATVFVTRYPCEACARALVTAQVSTIFYGRGQEISDETKAIFEAGNVRVFWVKGWTYEDVES